MCHSRARHYRLYHASVITGAQLDCDLISAVTMGRTVLGLCSCRYLHLTGTDVHLCVRPSAGLATCCSTVFVVWLADVAAASCGSSIGGDR